MSSWPVRRMVARLLYAFRAFMEVVEKSQLDTIVLYALTLVSHRSVYLRQRLLADTTHSFPSSGNHVSVCQGNPFVRRFERRHSHSRKAPTEYQEMRKRNVHYSTAGRYLVVCLQSASSLYSGYSPGSLFR